MAFYWNKKVLLAKIEAVYGTDPTPTGLANAMLATEIKLSPMEGQDLSRELDLPYLGGQRSIPTDLHMKLSFKVELQASGSLGVAPAWGPLLRACGVAQTIAAGVSVTYNPISSAMESATFYLHVDGSLYKMLGARGNAKFTVSPQGIPYIEFEFWGLWTAAAAAADATPTLTGFIAPIVASKTNTPTFTVGGQALIMRQFMMDMGNEVERRFLINDHSILIVDRAETIETTVEAVALGTWNPFALAAAQSAVVIALTHGTAVGQRVTLNVPIAQVMRTPNLENNQKIVEWPLRLTPIPNAGNDQWTLVLT
jgi:hypothetical protein